MAEIGLDIVDEVDDSDPYKRRVAILVVAIALFGSVVALMENRAGNHEEVAARETQRLAVSGLGSRVTTDAKVHTEQAIYTQSKVIERERVSAGKERGVTDAKRQADVQRLKDVQAALSPLSRLLSDKNYNNDASPGFEGMLSADEGVEADRAGLRATASGSLQNAYSKRAQSFVAVLTVLAVSLFLVGLSLTVVGSFRRYLIVPGILIAAWCVVWTALIATSPLHKTSERAIEMVAEGHRLEARAGSADSDDAVRKGLKDAIAQYDQAIADSPYFGPAYSSRADAVFKLGSPQDLVNGGFLSFTDDKSLKQSIADDKKALHFDNPNKIEILDNLSFNSMLANRLDDAEELALDVIDRNDTISRVWLNLGVIEVARGDESAAQDAYDRGLDLLRNEPDPIIRAQLYAGARTDLEEVIFLNDKRTDLAEKFEAQITGSEIAQAAGKDAPAAPNAKAGDIEFTPVGAKIHAEFDYSGIPAGAGVGFIWYYHQRDDSPFVSQQAARFDGDAGMSRALAFDGKGSGRYFVEGQIGPCPRPGEYRLDVFVGDRLVATGTTTVKPGPLGTPVAESSDLMSASLCRPADWQDDKSDPDVVTFASPDKGASFSVGSFLLNEADLPDNKVQAEDEFIRGFFGTDVPAISNFHLSGVAGRRGLVTKGGRDLNVVVFIGEDNSVHFIGAAGTTQQQFDVLDEMLATLQFSELPTHAVDRRVDEVTLHGDV